MSETPVVFEDERLLAYSKPAGRLVIAGRGLPEEPLSVEAARRCGGRAFVVHRIDRETSGLVIFAKDAAAHKSLCELFEARKIKKRYLALALGRLPARGLADGPIHEFGSGRMGVDPRGKAALTRWTVLQTLKNASLLGIEPETGRRHQIRAHLFNKGYPVIGDPLYGKDRPVGGCARLMLHALSLELPAPFEMRLEAPPAEDFLRELAARGAELPVRWPEGRRAA